MKNIIKKIKSFFEEFGDGDWIYGIIVLSSTTIEFSFLFTVLIVTLIQFLFY